MTKRADWSAALRKRLGLRGSRGTLEPARLVAGVPVFARWSAHPDLDVR